MNAPLLSVIIPVYNGEKYLDRAVASVVSQPESALIEILLIDDGSTDGSGALCDALSSQSNNIRVFHKENGGVASARNLGIQNASGKYVGFLDCDDWWEPSFFTADLTGKLSAVPSADVFQFAYQEVNTHFCLIKRYSIKERYEHYNQHAFGRYNWAPHCSFLISSQLLNTTNLLYPISKNFEDCAFIDMVMFCANSYCAVDRPMFSYWENPASCTHTSNVYQSLLEHHSALQQEKLFFTRMGIEFRGDIAWHITDSFPKLCAELDFNTLSSFMQEYCIDVLDQRPEECYQPKLWKRIELWRENPKKCYYYYRFTYGLFWNLKNRLIRLSSTSKAFNYLYNRFYRGFEPVRKK